MAGAIILSSTDSSRNTGWWCRDPSSLSGSLMLQIAGVVSPGVCLRIQKKMHPGLPPLPLTPRANFGSNYFSRSAFTIPPGLMFIGRSRIATLCPRSCPYSLILVKSLQVRLDSAVFIPVCGDEAYPLSKGVQSV